MGIARGYTDPSSRLNGNHSEKFPLDFAGLSPIGRVSHMDTDLRRGNDKNP